MALGIAEVYHRLHTRWYDALEGSATGNSRVVQTRPRRDYVLWISSPALIVFTAAFVWGAFSLYQSRIATISLTEHRFLTTEWRLLQQLKVQTDRQLLQKDQEIADLNRLYLELTQVGASPSRRQEVKNQLDQAEAERKAILSRSFSSIADTGSTQGTALNVQASSAYEPALAALLQNRIEGLQAQLDSRRALIDALDKERLILISTHQQAVQGYADTIREKTAEIQELSATLSRTRAEIQAAVATANRKAREAGSAQPLDIQDLKTRTLVRALVGSPEIRAVYPDLLKSLDRLFDVSALQERLTGQKEAYASLESTLAPLAAEAKAP